jgi:hypothetical protein
VKISKTEYVVFVQYQEEQTYKKIRTIGQREEMSCLISFGFSRRYKFLLWFMMKRFHFTLKNKNL